MNVRISISHIVVYAWYWTSLIASYDPTDDLNAHDVIDLTHTLGKDTPYYYDAGNFELNLITRGKVQDWWYEAYQYAGPEHGGTHIDAPSHFGEGQQPVDTIPLDNLIGHGIHMDFRREVALNADYEITVEDMKRWETQYGLLPDRSIVLLDTGWTHKWPDKKLIFGSDSLNLSHTYHFPGLHPGAAQWLVKERPQVTAVGIDSPSIDYGQTTKYLTHRILSANNIPNFENVANLHAVPSMNFKLFAIPMKIGGGTGGPLRVFALVPKTPSVEHTPQISPVLSIFNALLVVIVVCVVYSVLRFVIEFRRV